jgi:hypothetical protein
MNYAIKNKHTQLTINYAVNNQLAAAETDRETKKPLKILSN